MLASLARRSVRLHGRRLCTAPNPNPNPNPSPHFDKPLRHVIKSVIRERDPDALVSLFNALSSSDPRFRNNNRVYDIAVLRLVAAGRPDAVAALIEHQKSHPDFALSEGFAARLVALYGRAKMFPQALATFNSLRCPRRSALSFNSLLSAFARSHDDADCTAFLQDLQSSHPDFAPTVVSYNIVVSALCDRLAFNLAVDVLDLMEKKGLAPNIVTYNTLLHGFYSNGLVQEGEQIWDRMDERDVRSYNSRLRGLVNANRLADALKVFDEMTQAGINPDIYTFNALIKGYCQEGKLEEAKRVYLGLPKECVGDVMTFQMLVAACCEAEEYEFAAKLCNEGISMGRYVEPEAVQQVLDGLAKGELFLKAKKLLLRVKLKPFYKRKQFRVPLPCLAV